MLEKFDGNGRIRKTSLNHAKPLLHLVEVVFACFEKELLPQQEMETPSLSNI